MSKKKTLSPEEQTKLIITSTVQETIQSMSKLASIDRMKELKDETFKNTEKLLYNYNTLKEHVNDETGYFNMLDKKSSGSIVRYSKSKIATNYDEMLRAREESLNRSKNDLERLEKALGKVRKLKEFRVIELKYFKQNDNNDSYTFDEIAGLLNVDEKTARRWKNKIVKEISIYLFGSDAI